MKVDWKANGKPKRIAETLILSYLGNPENPFIYDKTKLCRVANITPPTATRFWPEEEWLALFDKAIALRTANMAKIRTGYTAQLLELDQTVLKKGIKGSCPHAELAYKRFEGPVATKVEVTGGNGGPVQITNFPPEPESLAQWEAMIKRQKADKPPKDSGDKE